METVQTVKCGYESPTPAANGAAVVQIGKVKYLSVMMKMSPQSPTVSRHVTAYVQSRWGEVFVCLGVQWWRKLGSRGRRSEGGEDQLEVSE